MEVASLLFLALDEGCVTEDEANSLFADIEQLAGGIGALNRSLEVKGSKTPFARSAPSRAVSVNALDPRPSTLDKQ